MVDGRRWRERQSWRYRVDLLLACLGVLFFLVSGRLADWVALFLGMAHVRGLSPGRWFESVLLMAVLFGPLVVSVQTMDQVRRKSVGGGARPWRAFGDVILVAVFPRTPLSWSEPTEADEIGDLVLAVTHASTSALLAFLMFRWWPFFPRHASATIALAADALLLGTAVYSFERAAALKGGESVERPPGSGDAAEREFGLDNHAEEGQVWTRRAYLAAGTCVVAWFASALFFFS